MKKPVLFLIFNRLDTTEKVFKEIKKAQPPRLYIASDGARENKESEKEIVQKTRDFVLNNIDWDCEVKTLFLEKNLGCRDAVSGAITWFFKQEEDGIILEDDCLPHPSFFNFCEELLNYYRDDKEIMHISGDQFISDYDNGASYYFAKIQQCWGWATWADRWQYFNYDLSDYDMAYLENLSENKNVKKYWLDILIKIKKNEVDSWAYPWTFNIIERSGLCINPSLNLVANIGFGEKSTHTQDSSNFLANLPVFNVNSIVHPKIKEIDQWAVSYIYENSFGIKG